MALGSSEIPYPYRTPSRVGAERAETETYARPAGATGKVTKTVQTSSTNVLVGGAPVIGRPTVSGHSSAARPAIRVADASGMVPVLMAEKPPAPLPTNFVEWAREELRLSTAQTRDLFATYPSPEGLRLCLRTLPNGNSPVPQLLEHVKDLPHPTDPRRTRRYFILRLSRCLSLSCLPNNFSVLIPPIAIADSDRSFSFRVSLDVSNTALASVPKGLLVDGSADFRGSVELRDVRSGVVIRKDASFRGTGLKPSGLRKDDAFSIDPSAVVEGKCDLRGLKIPPEEIPAGIPNALLGPAAG